MLATEQGEQCREHDYRSSQHAEQGEKERDHSPAFSLIAYLRGVEL